MAKYNRKKVTRLRKSHIGMSIFVLIAITSIGMILMMVLSSTVVSFLVNGKFEADAKRVLSLVDAYDPMREAGNSNIFEVLDLQGQTYFVVDVKGNIIHSNGENTCVMDQKVKYYDVAAMLEERYDSLSLYPDSKSGAVDPISIITGDIPVRKITEAVIETATIKQTEEDQELFVIENGRIQLPYWIAADVVDGRLFCKGTMDINISEVALMLMILSTLALNVIIVAIVLFINVIVSFVDQQRMKKLLFMDNVTEDHNWIRFYLEAGELLEKRRNARKNYAVINLVFVKYRNYVLCHSVIEGELELRKVYSTIRSSIGKKDLVGHDTSSSFAILMQYDDEKVLRGRIQEIIDKLSGINTNHKFNFQVGVDLIPASPRKRVRVDVDAHYNNACAARMTLEDTDESGIAFFSQEIVDEHKWIDKVQENQQRAVDKEEFVVYYQPKYDPNTNKLSGAEALIRWQWGDEFVSPGRFIPIFEENGFITEIDNYMLRHVARDVRKWLDQGLVCVPVSVNVSRAHFIEDNLAEQIKAIVDEEGCPAEYIEVELTESAFFDNKASMLDTIGRLKEYGFSVSMDDFGSGYSSLNSLKDLPLDVLKLDAGFFRGITDDDRGEKVVSGAIRLAKSLHMKIVAEGVEEQSQVDFLIGEGCDMIQGYYYAKPMPAVDYEQRMEKRDEEPGEDA